MKKILKLLSAYQQKSGKGLAWINIFSDGSGEICAFGTGAVEDKLFRFYSTDDLIQKLSDAIEEAKSK